MTYKRPTWQMLVLTALVATTASMMTALSRPVELLVDGQRIESDVPPVTTSLDKVYVPLRPVADALGLETMVQGSTIDVIRGNQSLRLHVGDVHARLNGMPMTLQHAPFRVRGRIMIGLKALSNAFNVRADYDARLARVYVMTPGIGEATQPATPETQ
jgi:hypothetical protein